MDIQGYNGNNEVGVKVNADGNLLINNFAARYQEAVLSGKVFTVSNQTGITTQAGLSATTPALTLYNAAGSGVNGVLLYAGCVNTVAFAAASVIWLGINSNVVAASVTGTATTAHRNNLLGSGSPTLQPLLAATLPAAPVGGPILGVGLTGAITTTPQLSPTGRWFDGGFIIAPGTAVSFQTSTASGASGFFGEFIWFETEA